MAANRKTVFANGEIYHIYNRGVEKRPTFTSRREFERAIETLEYYRFAKPPYRFSHFIRLDKELKDLALKKLSANEKLVEFLAYCLMPNHFHFLLRQIADNGISKFAANFTNSYTKYFNTKHDRIGPLCQGIFQGVHVESDEQLVHVSRYIHLNPVSSFLIKPEQLEKYEWSSYPTYLNTKASEVVEKRTILDFFSNGPNKYKRFVLDHVDYARNLERIKHLALE